MWDLVELVLGVLVIILILVGVPAAIRWCFDNPEITFVALVVLFTAAGVFDKLGAFDRLSERMAPPPVKKTTEEE